MRTNPKSRTPNHVRQGWEGWDDYAPFYDWENARTLGRRDVPFWRRIALEADGPVLELGCGTGRISLPLVRAGVDLVGLDRSAPMLERARSGLAKLTNSPTHQFHESSSETIQPCGVLNQDDLAQGRVGRPHGKLVEDTAVIDLEKRRQVGRFAAGHLRGVRVRPVGAP